MQIFIVYSSLECSNQKTNENVHSKTNIPYRPFSPNMALDNQSPLYPLNPIQLSQI